MKIFWLIYFSHLFYLGHPPSSSLSLSLSLPLFLSSSLPLSPLPLKGGFWAEQANRKAFLDEFAKDKGFDPLIPANWYLIKRQQLLKKKVNRKEKTKQENKERRDIIVFYGLLLIYYLKYSKSVLSYYRSSLGTALLNLYPNIGLEAHILFARGNYIFLFFLALYTSSFTYITYVPFLCY